MEIDEFNSVMCDGCTERDEKIKQLSIEIDDLKRDLEYQKNVVQHFSSSSRSTTFPALNPVREESNESYGKSSEEMAIDAPSDSSSFSNRETVNKFKHMDVDKNDKETEFQLVKVESDVSFPSEQPADPVQKRA